MSEKEDLWELLTKLSKEKKPGQTKQKNYSKSAKKRAKKEREREKLRQSLGLERAHSPRPSPREEKWQALELVLFAHEWECICCGRKGTSPNGQIMLRQRSKRDPKLIWLRPLETFELSNYASLPRRVEYRPRVGIPACPFCFDLEQVYEGAKTHPALAQLPLPSNAIK